MGSKNYIIAFIAESVPKILYAEGMSNHTTSVGTFGNTEIVEDCFCLLCNGIFWPQEAMTDFSVLKVAPNAIGIIDGNPAWPQLMELGWGAHASFPSVERGGVKVFGECV